MDSLSSLLADERGRDAFVLRCQLGGPWSMRIADRAEVALIAMVQGACSIVPDHGPALRLTAGDVAVIKGPDPYVVCDDPGTPIQVIIEPGQICRAPDGRVLMGEMSFGLRTWGNDPAGECSFIAAAYELPSQFGSRLLPSLPTVVATSGTPSTTALMDLLDTELSVSRPGQDGVLDRLVDMLLITALREWFAADEARAPGWWTAQSDPVVGAMLTLVHDAPEHEWTVAELAARVGYSRAAAARRFSQLVGTSPMSYLTTWRMTLAADLLREGSASIETIARRVGYANPFAFSHAFKRDRGLSPRDFRRAAPTTGGLDVQREGTS